MRAWMVLKFVRVPPSHLVLMKKAPLRFASDSTVSEACFFVPTNTTFLPSATVSSMNWHARSMC